MPVRSRPIIERHIQTALLAVIVAAIGWAGSSLIDVREGFARQDERLTNLAQQFADVQSSLKELSTAYYPKSDAERELGNMRTDIRNLRERVTVLEGKSQ
ncbi:hypothetical protein EVC62_02215 [Salinicola endophyticus]|uniref:Uncharacterized protein n=1 Tax=Salinicola endophyticus TaxID=1949083 RepID=A0ABY8FC72_9GAMM|nr:MULTISPECIES: hypothetical protein [Salinicola]WFF40408.1 hypothetical protein EVC62_02215 [Salinicola endophyticus]WIX34134.1 hypothetical protein QO259_05585 [Salinicola sp. JS01]